MNKSYLIIGALIIIFLVVGFWFVSNNDVNEVVLIDQEEEVVENIISEEVGSYQAYSDDKLALAQDERVVLFFHAGWCPTCRALNTDLENNISNIPTDVNILKIDYDNATELKSKYEVTTQHTLVEVDQFGNLLNKWTGGLTLADLLTNLD